ncbi:hypothetical protein DID88_008404 [Monilinia fructigena]|uniref:Uncharacterized protein n=1 Tax=Monilinia fructigena TaxID=38457 RepID=A0A395J691_9HELO|nr:hypothetical protein DID88_008404 [Monilinia fructigena]
MTRTFSKTLEETRKTERPERRQERDVQELLANGFFKTSRARSPSPFRQSPSPPSPPKYYTSTFLNTSDRDVGRARSRSRVRSRAPPPPRPTVEDEATSLARESPPSAVSSYDPPHRGVIDQYPIILESEVSEGEVERLHAAPRSKESRELGDNSERRFVLVPGTDASSTSQSTNQDTSESSRPRGRSEQGKPARDRDEAGRTKINIEPTSKPPPLERKKTTSEDSKRFERLRSGQSERESGSERARSPRRSATSNLQYYSGSEDDVESEQNFGRRRHGHRRAKDLRPEDDYELRVDSPRANNRPSNHPKLSSQLPSPRISPNQLPRTEPFERAETFPQARRPDSRPVSPFYAPQETPRADRLNPMSPGLVPRPSSRQSNASEPISMPQMQQIPAPFPHHVLPIPIPIGIDLHYPVEARRTPTMLQYEDDRPPSTRPAPNDKPYWQPPAFQPSQVSSDNLEKPVGSYRRYSEDVDRGGVRPLPSCPRMNPTTGYQDWLTLPQCPNFDICPSCFNSIIAPTDFRNHFIPAARRPEIPIIWRRNDLGLFYGLANVGATEEPCLGKRDALNRSWNSIIDPKTGLPIKNFDVCHSCVRSVEVLLPPIRGIFVRTLETAYSSSIPRICDLRFDSKRFVRYFDALETTADDAAYHNSSPDTRALAKLARKFSVLEECQQSTDLPDRRWYFITQLPDFTVCEECFDDVVVPELEDGKAIPLMFTKVPQRIQKASCQLYSERMRVVFQKACNSDDYMLLATKARERKNAELAWKVNVAATKRQSRESMVPNPLIGREIQRLNDEWRKWE